jgi:hypothetical protein
MQLNSLNYLRNLIKLKTRFVVAFASVTLISFSINADDNNPLKRFDYNLESGIDIYLAPRLLNFIGGNLDSVLERNGFSPSSFYIHEVEKRTGQQPLEDIVTNPSLLSSIKSLRYQFRKFFSGITIRNNHDLEIKTNGIDLSAHWSKFGVKLLGHEGEKNTITAIFVLEADRLSLNIQSLLIQDHRHKFIGEIGGEKFYINLDQSRSTPLNVIIPIEISLSPESEIISLDVKQIESNIGSIDLTAGWNAPLKLPRIKVTVNNRTSYMRASVVERTLKREIPNILKGIQENLEEYLLTEAPIKVEEKLKKTTDKGYQDFISVPILFNPTEEKEVLDSEYLEITQQQINYPDKAILGMKLNQFGMRKNHFRLQLNSFLEDGQLDSGRFIQPSKRGRKEVSPKFLTAHNYDIMASINIGLINQYLRISCDRGYLRQLTLGDEEIQVVGCPYVKTNESANELRLIVNIVNDVDFSWYQISNYAINGPIVVRFELGLSMFRTLKNKIGLKLNKIYSETAYIAPRYINFGSDSVHNAAREELEKYNQDIKGMVIEEEIPLPSEIMGIPLKYKYSKIDNNGNILFYLDTIL